MMVKICGITNRDDALLAVECGATAIGFNFYPPSPRFLDPREAARIVSELPPSILAVAVCVGVPDFPLPAGFRAWQLHGLTTPDEVPRDGGRVIVAVTPQSAGRFSEFEIIVDSSWGRGRRENWSALAGVRRPFILSGGLTPENVKEAVELLCPAGVDVCSGVEQAPGKKDPDKLKRFIENTPRAYEARKEG